MIAPVAPAPENMAFNQSFLCGCYFIINSKPKYLPSLKVEFHTTIIDSVSRTTLTQTFVNPLEGEHVGRFSAFNRGVANELRYMFPLYDGVSVSGFSYTVSDRAVEGVVKERQTAKNEYNQAIQEGRKAGLLEQSLNASDVFTTSIGNVLPGKKIVVTITYLAELKHDAQNDGLRLTIPARVAPRYGAAALEATSSTLEEESMSITIDVEMSEGSNITSVESSSHPITVSIGSLSTMKNAPPCVRKASASLSQASTGFEKDFVITIVATMLTEPSAFMETHSTIPNHCALMTTLVPKFNLPVDKPEIVFICDRSGSMDGRIGDLVDALVIFLKSLPLGVRFNICSFGTWFEFLWPKSKRYGEETLKQAMAHVQTFKADLGGTEMRKPMDATFNQRFKDRNLEVFLLTDGEIWDQGTLFALIHNGVTESEGRIRVFSLGIGSGASSALIEGVARAGKGFAQTVQNSEKMEKKVVRMLKGALLPHIDNYTLEIKYTNKELEEEEGYEMIERVMDSLELDDLETVAGDEINEVKLQKPISLHDPNFVEEVRRNEGIEKSAVNDDDLPPIQTPRYLQTPTTIPPLFPFIRSTFYVLLSDCNENKTPKSVLLKATSQHGPLELEIPIVTISKPSTAIHQLAARREILELEEGRGWLLQAKDSAGQLLCKRFETRLSDMVRRESVRLGVKYQVSSKWCSFVAVEQKKDDKEPPKSRFERQINDGEKPYLHTTWTAQQLKSPLEQPIGYGDRRIRHGAEPRTAKRMRKARGMNLNLGISDSIRNIYGKLMNRAQQKPTQDLKMKEPSRGTAALQSPSFATPDSSRVSANDVMETSSLDAFRAIVVLQTFKGNWVWDKNLETKIGLSYTDVERLELPGTVAKHQNKESIMATICAIVFLKKNHAEERDAWEMLVEKAQAWLREQIDEDVVKLQKVVESLF